MSRRSLPQTVAERIEDVRKRTPPPRSRKARQPYISKEDFAKLLGVTRARIFAWTTEEEEKRAYPDPQNRAALAKLSGGRYRPDDFAPLAEPTTGNGSAVRRLGHRVSDLEAAVSSLERHIFGEDEAPD